MNIDNTPAIRAFVEARIERLKSGNPTPGSENAAGLRELEMILKLCDGLQWFADKISTPAQARKTPELCAVRAGVESTKQPKTK